MYTFIPNLVLTVASGLITLRLRRLSVPADGPDPLCEEATELNGRLSAEPS